MSGISGLILADREFSAFLGELKTAFGQKKSLPIAVNGLSGGAVYAALAEAVRSVSDKAPSLILAPTDEECVKIREALESFSLRTARYKQRDFIFDSIGASHDTERERLSVLLGLTEGEYDCIVTTPAAAAARTVPVEFLTSHTLSIRPFCEMSHDVLIDKLLSLGYSMVDSVESRGQFSHRGGIVDFFSGDEKLPVRIEFFGDEIDRMVYFDPITQRYADECSGVVLMPAEEVVLDTSSRSAVASSIEKLIPKCKSQEVVSRLEYELNNVKNNLHAEFRDKYIGIIYEKFENLFTYFESLGKFATFTLGTGACRESLEKYSGAISDTVSGLLSNGAIDKKWAKYTFDTDEYEDFIKNRCVSVHINSFAGGLGSTPLAALFGFRSRRCVSYGNNISMLREDLESYKRGGYRVLILAPNRQGAQSLVSTLLEWQMNATLIDTDKFDVKGVPGGTVFVAVGCSEGFDLIVPKIAVLSTERDEGWRVMQNKRRQRIMKKSSGERLMSYADLSVGDYVVHANYGIGLFEGIQTVTADGVTRDYITIKYAGTDKLLVPCDRLDAVGKYIGERDSSGGVKLSKMGGGDWTRAKSRAKSAAKDIAKELIALYAERQRMPGFAFPADSDMEEQFAAAFEYEETFSQTEAINDIKRDMMRPVPMNRLLCGDVGFGKTEVALRAAFKAIMGGKQVAILVPTTILALQHMGTAVSRMRGYPISVEMLSGLCTPKEQDRILRAVERGACDVLIGTHKLLSKKLKFRDLGLLIIDEEQRFGVSQKEKLRQMAKNVDTLTLSATPIPRTLNMAMNGICDMSILDEAPGERRPVQTYVLEHDEIVVHDAIRRELTRGGQVLYLYNKVEDIGLVAGRIMKAFPEARVAAAHGQMEREELEDIWQGLVRAEIDIVVCTTIIETGIDLPNANTLIIENADRFGLSQLHQIRGRVGRSERQAYAYLTYRPGKVLTEIAEKRLRAIRDFAEFGAGFKVALRDLEIRGAGNLLGAEQHGHIASVGYDLYVKLLSEAVLEEQGICREAKQESVVDIRVSANIPEGYIRDSASRMEMYKKISLIRTREDLYDVADEFSDRFGNMPKSTVRLLDVALIKALAEETGINRVEERSGVLTFYTEKPDGMALASLMSEFSGMTFRHSTPPSFFYKLHRGDEVTGVGRKILEAYKKIKDKSKEEDDGNEQK